MTRCSSQNSTGSPSPLWPSRSLQNPADPTQATPSTSLSDLQQPVAQGAMALLERTTSMMTGAVWAVVTVPWSSLKLLELAIRWSASMAEASEPKSSPPVWADDLFSATKKDWGPSCSCEDLTDGSDSEIFEDEEDDDGWSSEEEDLDGFSVGIDGFVDFWGDRWLWELNTDDDESQGGEKARLQDGEVTGWSSYSTRRLVSYMMPSMDLNTDGAVDVWVDRYGSSGPQFHYVAISAHQLDACDDLAAVELLPSLADHFIVTL